MKRLVYAPEVNAWVKTDTGIFDLSPYITGFSVNRKVNSVSHAELTFRNPKIEGEDGMPRFMFTQHQTKAEDGTISTNPMFHPMDPITITLTRLKGYPVQVFTGYIDTAPYVQLFPGVAKLSASCTLKRLLYTYWDPGLKFVNQYMIAHGWTPTPSGVTYNQQAESSKGPLLNDSTIAQLLYDVLHDVGNWKYEDIYIQSIPAEQLSKAVDAIYKENTGDAKASYATFREFLKNIVGVGYLGGAGAPGGTGTADVGSPTGSAANVLTNGQKIFINRLAELTGLDKGVITAWVLAEESGGAARSRESQNNHNWLNIGWFDSGRGSITYNQTWGSALAGAQASSDFLHGRRFGPSQGIRNIIKTAGRSPSEQIAAIQNSGWASSGYPDLPQLYRQYGKT